MKRFGRLGAFGFREFYVDFRPIFYAYFGFCQRDGFIWGHFNQKNIQNTPMGVLHFEAIGLLYIYSY